MSIAHEAQIKHLGDQMTSAYAKYEATGCFDSRGQADAYRLQMERAISERSPLAVAAMESERGLV